MNNISLQNAQKSGKSPLFILIIILFGFILYGNTLSHDYALDDAIVITQNVFTQQGVQGIDEIFKYDSFVGFWLNSYKNKTADEIQQDKKLVAGGRYRPLSFAVFAIEHQIFGDNPHVHHFFNVFYYILTSIMLYLFLLELFPKKEGKNLYLTIPFVTVLLFMAHPVHTEVVANIKGRDELLSLLGAITAGWAYVKYLGNTKLKYLIVAFFAMFLGLLSKEITIAWLAVIPVFAWMFKEQNLKKHLKPFLSIFVPTIIFLLIRQSVLGWGSIANESNIAQELMNNPFLEAKGTQHAGTILFTLWVYIRLLIFPHPLTYDYYPYHIPLHEITDPICIFMFVLYLFFIVVLILSIIKYYRNKASVPLKVVGVSLLMFLAPLSVVSNIFFPIGAFMGERFIYFSSLGFVFPIAWILVVFLQKRITDLSKYSKIAFSILIIILSLYSIKSVVRNKAWKDDFTLFTTDVKTSKNSAKSNTSAGGKLLERAKVEKDKKIASEEVDQAIVYLNRALEIHPMYVDPMILLGNAHYQKNRNIAKALHWYAEILKIRPYHNLAISNARLILPQVVGLFAQKNSVNTPDEIINACKEFDSVKSGVPEIYRIMGLMYARYKNDFKTAIPYYEKALEINPNDLDSWKDLGVIYGQSGNFERALNAFKKSFELNPEDAQAVFNIAVTYQNTGNIDEANKWFSKYKVMSGKVSDK